MDAAFKVDDLVSFETEQGQERSGTITEFVKKGRWEYAVVAGHAVRPNKLKLVMENVRPSTPPPAARRQPTIRPPKPREDKPGSVITKEYKKCHLPDPTYAEMTLDQLYAKAQKTTDIDLRAKYAHLNVGMQRMNLTNRLRGAK